MKSLISFLFGSFQKQRGRLRESVKRKERREKVKVGQEEWLREKEIEDSGRFYQSMSCYIYADTLVNAIFLLKPYAK